jgi:hypothetical protein
MAMEMTATSSWEPEPEPMYDEAPSQATGASRSPPVMSQMPPKWLCSATHHVIGVDEGSPVAWAHDASMLAFAGGDYGIYVAANDGGRFRVVTSLFGSRGRVRALSFHPRVRCGTVYCPPAIPPPPPLPTQSAAAREAARGVAATQCQAGTHTARARARVCVGDSCVHGWLSMWLSSRHVVHRAEAGASFRQRGGHQAVGRAPGRRGLVVVQQPGDAEPPAPAHRQRRHA